ncbi:hypothetical protein [Psychrobacter frigidicola]|uniref:hypothetical protein n=1 Tax=Psychrobacter frigidicola TaxID=45611 RepID=UPI00191A545B|nr:hypothetical protein [Psychrobacter frigidicola]
MSEDKAKHCFAQVQDESCARGFKSFLIGTGIVCCFYHPTAHDLNPIEKKWAKAKFLRQGWMEINLKKLFHDMGCISFI